ARRQLVHPGQRARRPDAHQLGEPGRRRRDVEAGEERGGVRAERDHGVHDHAPAVSLKTLAAPAPAPVEAGRAGRAGLSGGAEVACVDAWSAACRAWWEDAADPRLRERASEALLLGDDELAAWLVRRLDPPALIRAHEHVTCMRAGLERDLSLRELTV